MNVLYLFGPNLGALGTREPLAHSSYTLRDAVAACAAPVIEVHMSNIYAREPFRQTSVISGVCRATIGGLGAGGYHLALEAMPWITG
jgi:3-dehydroquinate dehydratase-2